jgi:hypothetical protein
MAAPITKISAYLEYVGIDNAMNPCGKCGVGVSETCDFRFYIFEEDLNTNQITNQIINIIKEIPLDCPCINIDELSLGEPLNILIAKRVLFYCIDNCKELKIIKEILSRYMIFMDDDIVNNCLEEYFEGYEEEYKEDIFKSNYVIIRIKLFREIYEELTNINLKPAKQ